MNAASGGARRWAVLAWVPAALILDQLTKWIAVESLVLHQPVPVLGDIVRLTYIHNAGAAFGMKLGGPVLHTLVAVVALGILGWVYMHLPGDARWQRTALAMVLGGAVGNIVDRVRLDYVIDFIDVGVAPGWRWPVFNIADSFVTVGVLVLAATYARSPRPAADDVVDTAATSGPSAGDRAAGS